jgi:hypothetical protein
VLDEKMPSSVGNLAAFSYATVEGDIFNSLSIPDPTPCRICSSADMI